MENTNENISTKIMGFVDFDMEEIQKTQNDPSLKSIIQKFLEGGKKVELKKCVVERLMESDDDMRGTREIDINMSGMMRESENFEKLVIDHTNKILGHVRIALEELRKKERELMEREIKLNKLDNFTKEKEAKALDAICKENVDYLERLGEETEKLTCQKRALEKEIKELETDIEEMKAELNSAKNEKRFTNNEIHKLNFDINSKTQYIEQLEFDIKKLEHNKLEIDELRKQIEELKVQNQNLQNLNDKLKEELTTNLQTGHRMDIEKVFSHDSIRSLNRRKPKYENDEVIANHDGH